ncbi:MAG: hypothetical protein WC657_07325 [Candidatus Paceibacterota bacterium]|jgi:hypothetical protein
MKKCTLITLTLLLLIAGPTLYFLTNDRDQGTSDHFSTFGFKNDPVERGEMQNEDGTYGVDGDIEEATQSDGGDGGWFSKLFRRSGNSTDSTRDSSGTAESQTTAGGGQGTAGSGSADGSAAQTGGTVSTEGSSVATTGTANPTPATTPTPATLTVVSPKAGDVLSNKTCPTTGDTPCTEAPVARIFWTYGDATARITIELWSKTSLARTLATKTQNSGRYTWNPSPTLPDGDYKLVLRAYAPSGTLLSTGETGYFEVSKVKEAEVDEPGTTPTPPPDTRVLSRDYIGTTDIPCPWGETRIGPCKYQGKLMSEGYPPPDASGFTEVDSGKVPYYGETNHQPLYLGGSKKWAVKFRGDTAPSAFPVTFGAGTVTALQVPVEMFVGISRTKGDFFDVAPGCLITPATLGNPGAGGAPHSGASINVAWEGGPYDQEAYAKNGTLCILEPNGYYYVNVAGTCSEYWDPDHTYLGWQNDCPTVLTNVNGWMTYLSPDYVNP